MDIAAYTEAALHNAGLVNWDLSELVFAHITLEPYEQVAKASNPHHLNSILS